MRGTNFWDTLHNALIKLFTQWCLDKAIGQIESGLERGFVKHWVNYVKITGP